MGCDIHAHVEVKLENIWHHYSCPNIDRDYNLFSFLAGVREFPGSEPCIFPCRGLPTELSDVTAFDYLHWQSDAHHISWMKKEEARIAQNWYEERNPGSRHSLLWGYVFGCNVDTLLRVGHQDTRVIFWFDN